MTLQRLAGGAVPLYLAVFIDLLSYGLMYPVIVALFHSGWVAQAFAPATRDLLLSLSFSFFPIGMLFGAPLLGDLSDALGRRRTLMLCMAGLAAAYGVLWLSLELTSVAGFLVGRLLCGLLAGASPIAQATAMERAAQRHGEQGKGRALADLNIVSSASLVVGPALGGLLGHLDLRLPLAAALLLCLGTLGLLALARPAQPERRRPLQLGWLRPLVLMRRAFRTPALRPFMIAFVCYEFGYLIYYTFVLVLLQRSHGFTTYELGLFSMAMGAGTITGAGPCYRWARARLGSERAVTRAAQVTCAAFVLISALPLGLLSQWICGYASSAAAVLVYLSLLAQMSEASGEDEQGSTLGVAASITAGGVFLAGLLAAVLTLVPIWALMIVSGLIVLSGVLALRRPRSDQLAMA